MVFRAGIAQVTEEDHYPARWSASEDPIIARRKGLPYQWVCGSWCCPEPCITRLIPAHYTQ
jgi:hypothetical protein